MTARNGKQGIPTNYRGITFRSRLEARWAAFFVELGWTWEYEPYDLAGWIPDFVIVGERPLLIEIKPAASVAELERLVEPAHRFCGRDVLMLGVSPAWTTAPDWPDGLSAYPIAGWLGEHETGRPEVWFNAGAWARCTGCGAPGIFHLIQSYAMRPCGHHDGDHYLGALEVDEIDEMWAAACNRVQWKARR